MNNISKRHLNDLHEEKKLKSVIHEAPLAPFQEPKIILEDSYAHRHLRLLKPEMAVLPVTLQGANYAHSLKHATRFPVTLPLLQYTQNAVLIAGPQVLHISLTLHFAIWNT